MHVKKLEVHGVRNIASALLFPSPYINIIYGENGSGKTSLLEAIYLLGRGRSFRTRNLQSIINAHVGTCNVFALLTKTDRQDSPETPIGVNRSIEGNFKFKIAGQRVNTASRLAETLPLLLMNSDSFGLIEGSPSDRRRFLDWGVFHVEQSFRSAWQKLKRCHKQRNSVLRHATISPSQLAVWDKEFVELSERIADLRQHYFAQIQPEFTRALEQLDNKLNVDLHLYRGWSEGSNLADELKHSLARDLKAKMTHWGAHRADLKLTSRGVPAAEALSRGQTKLAVLALHIAQGRVFSKMAGRRCLYLLDDLGAELDHNHLNNGLKLLSELGAQIFITGTDRTALLAALPKSQIQRLTLFHVKQGGVQLVASNDREKVS